MPTTPPLRVVLAGTGYFSQFHIDAWRRIDGVNLVGVWDPVGAAAKERVRNLDVPVFDSVDALLDATSPDLLDIVAPPAGHLPLIEAASARGTDIICQKPFCRSADEADEATGLAEARGVTLVVHENFRFQPWYREIRRLIDAGVLGTLWQVSFRLRPGDGRGDDAYQGRQPFFRTMDRFLIRETAVHFIDTFRFLFGPITGVTARLRRLNPVIAGEDAGIVVFDFASGAAGIFDGNRLGDHVADNQRRTMGEMTIEGSEATLRLDGAGRLFLRRFGDAAEVEHAYAWSDRGFGGDCVLALQAHVVAHLRSGAPLENAARDYLDVQTVAAAIYESHETGRHVWLPG